MMLERGSPMRRRTGGWRVKQLHIVLLRARAFLSCSELFRCDQKCNKSTVRCELKTLTLLSLPSLKFLSYDTTRELENKICEDGLQNRAGSPTGVALSAGITVGSAVFEDRGGHLNFGLWLGSVKILTIPEASERCKLCPGKSHFRSYIQISGTQGSVLTCKTQAHLFVRTRL